MNKKSTYSLIIILSLFLGFATKNTISAQNTKWTLIMSKGNGYTAQSWRTRTTFPSKEIDELREQGYEITSLSYGMKLWSLVASKGTKYTQQQWKTSTIFPADIIKQAWNDGFYITELTYGNGEWAVVFSKGSTISNQVWRTRSYFPEDEINTLKGQGYDITNICFGEDRWALVMSKGTGMDNQVWFKNSSFPDTKIKSYWDSNYYITSITYGNGEWVVVMSKGTSTTDQSWRTRTYYPEKEIKELWDKGNYITGIVSDFDSAPISLNDADVIAASTGNIANKNGSISLKPKWIKTTSNYTYVNIDYTGATPCCIGRDTYLEDPASGVHYNLVSTVGIPICETNYYKTSNNFSLVFDKVPTEVKKLNLVELPSTTNAFNLIGMKLDGSVASPATITNVAADVPAGLPPILTIEDISLSSNSLGANETAKLSVTLKNVGPGDAQDVLLNLESNLKDIQFNASSPIPTIAANGGKQTITIPITGTVDLPSTIAQLKIEVEEPHFKVKIQGKQLSVPTREFQKPQLLLAKYAVVENQSSNPNNQIDINEMVDLVFAVQNVGLGNAANVTTSVTNNQKGVMFLGVVNGNQLVRQNPTFNSIASGKYETVTYRYFINSEFTDSNLQFTINAGEKVGRFGFSLPKSFAINTKLSEEGFIRTVASTNTNTGTPSKVIIEDIPDFVVDVDSNIPTTNNSNNSAYALIIGNEDYNSRQTGLSKEQNVEFAVNDANMFALYCEKTLGIPKRQIKVLLNATAAEISQGLAWLTNLAKVENGNAELFFYYSGHGLPDEQTKEAYLVPVDVNGSNLTYAIKVADVYKTLAEQPTKKVNVFLDACFSGGGRNEGLLAVKGVKVRPKENTVPEQMVVLTSSTGDESSAVFKEKRHGYFTYFLLKKLQESKGEISYNDLSSYIIQNVRKETSISGKIQTPQVIVSPNAGDSWKTWLVK
jgi:Uncharacterized protein containing caspase domain